MMMMMMMIELGFELRVRKFCRQAGSKFQTD